MFTQMKKHLDRLIPNSIVFSIGQTTFGRWSKRLECAQLRITRKGRCLYACHNGNTKLEMFGLDKRILALDSI